MPRSAIQQGWYDVRRVLLRGQRHEGECEEHDCNMQRRAYTERAGSGSVPRLQPDFRITQCQGSAYCEADYVSDQHLGEVSSQEQECYLQRPHVPPRLYLERHSKGLVEA